MIDIPAAWAGEVQFYELVFGAFPTFFVLVWMWEHWLKTPLPTWRYVMITFLAAGAFWINHYFQRSPGWLWAINLYTVAFLFAYWWLGARGRVRAAGWHAGVIGSAILLTFVFIGFEQLARLAVRQGVHEFWIMLVSFFGWVAMIAWSGQRRRAAETHK
ncbi:MAG: hypothetical protein HC872_01210 [Gammaproteobacteria bacterium]|nr:hypothetical protein [Gammaproteobacteria bacterium]